MRIQHLHPWIGLFALGIGATLPATSARADVPPLDFPAACLPSLDTSTLPLLSTASWSAYARLPSSLPGVADSLVMATALRTACGGNQAALQLRLAGFPQPLLDPYVKLPVLTVQQNGREAEIAALRVSAPGSAMSPEPVAAGALNASPGMYVLTSNGTGIDLTDALTLNIRHPDTHAIALSLNLPRYVSHTTGPRPINGRYAGNFFDPAKSGEGIIIEIGDLEPGTTHHHLQFSWFTYDNDGRPFWITGGSNFEDGATRVHMPAIHRSGGRFAGGKAADHRDDWGTVDIEFSDCNTLNLGYHANSGLPAQIPGGQGELQWQRLTGVSGYRCN